MPDTATTSDAGPLSLATTGADSLEQFLSGIGARAFRFADLGFRHRDEAPDAV